MAARRDVCPRGGGLARRDKGVNHDNTNGVKLKPDATPPSDPHTADPEVDHPEKLDADAPAVEAAAAAETAAATADNDGDDVADRDSADEKEAEPADPVGREPRRLSVTVSARSLVFSAVLALLVGALATVVWLYVDAQQQLNAQARQSDNNAHAEKVALDYAVNAATMNYQDLGGWKTKLVAGTSPELNGKLSKAAESMQQILVPLQWNSTAQPLVAKVRSDIAGVYVVDCFVSVQTKTAQGTDPLQSTATYSLTIDRNKNWQITDVGGITAVTGQR